MDSSDSGAACLSVEDKSIGVSVDACSAASDGLVLPPDGVAAFSASALPSKMASAMRVQNILEDGPSTML